LYGFENWSLAFSEEQKLRVFETRALRRISGSKRAELTGGSRKLHVEESHYLYSSTNVIIVAGSCEHGNETWDSITY
jgi:hypothetical protein